MSDPNKTSEGGFAFPVCPANNEWGNAYGGMSLRDYFAAKAMAATIASERANDAISEMMERRSIDTNQAPAFVAEAAYVFADAMLAARLPAPESQTDGK